MWDTQRLATSAFGPHGRLQTPGWAFPTAIVLVLGLAVGAVAALSTSMAVAIGVVACALPAALQAPRLTFVGLLAARFVSDAATDPSAVSSSTSTAVLTAATLLFAALVFLPRLRDLARVPWSVALPFVAFIGWVGTRWLGGSTTAEGLRETAQWSSYLVAFLVGGVLFGSDSRSTMLVRVVVIGGLFQAVLALTQRATGQSIAYYTVDQKYERVSGTFPHAGWLAFFLAVCILLIPATGWRRRSRELAAVVLLLGTVLTFSRGALVFLVVGLLIHAVLRRRIRIALYGLSGACIAMLLPPIRTRFLGEILNGQLEGSYRSRAALRDHALEAWFGSPIVGRGSGFFFDTFSEQRFGQKIEAHSDILKILADQGVVGLVLYLTLLASVFRWIRRGSPQFHSSAAVIAALPLMGVVDVYYRMNTTLVLFWAVVGAVVAAAARLPMESSSGTGTLTRGARARGGSRPPARGAPAVSPSC